MSEDMKLRKGDQGAAVAAMQDLLNRTGALLSCDGDFGAATQRAVRECQAEAGLAVTGEADAALRTWLQSQPEPSPDIPVEAVTALVRFEAGGRAGYDAGASKPHWPGGHSGITIGLGYDLRFHSLEEFRRDWRAAFNDDNLSRLAVWLGKPGSSEAARALADISVPFQTAWRVFCAASLPKYVAETRRVFPGFDNLPPLCRGALTSLVYNRGGGMEGDDRHEMRAIRDHVAAGRVDKIAAEFESMKRLWPAAEGLRRRRDAEADLWRRGLDVA